MDDLIKRLRNYSLTAEPYQSYTSLMAEAADALERSHELVDAAKLTLNENLHLCDGDVCTLRGLKEAVEKIDPIWMNA